MADLYAGRYRLDSDTILIVTPAGAGFEVQAPLSETFALIPVSRVSFVRRDEETRYTFGRREDGGAQLTVTEESTTRTAPRVNPSTRVPAEDLAAGRVDEAVAAYKKLQAANPADPAIAERRLNERGYGFLQKKDYATAIALFRLNTGCRVREHVRQFRRGLRRAATSRRDRHVPEVRRGGRAAGVRDRAAEPGRASARRGEAEGAVPGPLTAVL